MYYSTVRIVWCESFKWFHLQLVAGLGLMYGKVLMAEKSVEKRLSNQVALVTGGAKGIGEAIVRKLAQAGCDIVINYFNSSDRAEQLCEEVKQLGVRVFAIQANVADPKSVKEMFSEMNKHFNRLDILVSNAASGVLKPAMEMSLKHWSWCLETNSFALNLLA